MPKTQDLNKNVAAFLDMIAWSEGTSTHKLTKNDGYDVIVTGVNGPSVFTDYGQHPFANGKKPICVNKAHNLYSTASGRYQFLVKYWLSYKKQLSLPDFGPASQDKWAIQLIRERHALDDIKKGNIADAIEKCSNIWASFAGSTYGQPTHSLHNLLMRFAEYGGSVKS